MTNYEKMYYHLFNAVSDALAELERCNYGAAGELLKSAQCACEELFLQQSDAQESRNESHCKAHNSQ